VSAAGQLPPTAVGITGTVPVEVLYAGGRQPVDLNNIFITGHPLVDIRCAEGAGFPVNCCAWIKGLYGAVRRLGIKEVLGVAQGDCSNTHALLEIWVNEGLRVRRFEYPYPPSREALSGALAALCRAYGVTLEAAEAERQRLRGVRDLLAEIDELTWRTGQVSGWENHLWLIGASDFGGDPDDYRRRAEAFLRQARGRAGHSARLRLGYIGIPPICEGLYEFLEELGGRMVFNEFQRQFAMLDPAADLVEQYLNYTYPYGIEGRIADIRRQAQLRRLDGLVHYVQSFCYRHIQDRLLREGLDLPILTLEYDRPGPLDGRSRTRLEAFLELVENRRRRAGRQI
jgi:benzoyl-CoA reductase/2-hydroxyglutaryl-CoA dehydratase subunit BcrC/BadD/HgdB